VRILAVAILLPLTLSACTASVERRQIAVTQQASKIMDSCWEDASVSGIDVNAAAALSARTIFWNPDSMDTQMLTYQEFASDEEKPSIAALMETWKVCGEKQTAYAAKQYNPQVAGLYRMDVNRKLVELANLYNGDIKWNAFNVNLLIYDFRFREALEQATGNYWRGEYADAERRQAAVAAALQAYGNALKDYGKNSAGSATRPPVVQQMPIYDPVRTSCRENGNSVTCTQTSNLMTAPKIIKCRVNGSVMTCTEQ
jgi:hypothetical protein